MGYERARKNLNQILRSLASTGQKRVAERMKLGESTVSKMRNQDNGEIKITFPSIADGLAEMGLKVVPEHWVCMEKEKARVLRYGHAQWANSLQQEEDPLDWDQE